MGKLKFIIFCTLALLAITLTSCRDHDWSHDYKYDKMTETEIAYAKTFEDEYGEPEVGFTSMTAEIDTLSLDLTSFPSGSYKVQFYTGDPCDDNIFAAYLLGEFSNIKGGAKNNVNFDYPIGITYTYCTIISTSANATWTAPIEMTGTRFDTVAVDYQVPDTSFTEREPMHYTLAFEGYTPEGIDFDYNDIILDLEYVQGRDTELKIVLEAVGNSCATKVTYRPSYPSSTKGEQTIFEEAHAALGYQATYSYAEKRDVYYILNTGVNDSGKTDTVTYSLGTDTGLSITQIAPKFVCSFITNDSSDTPTASESYIPYEHGVLAPMGLLLAVPDWGWMPEGMMIHVAYSRFPYWIAYPKQYPLWYTTMWN